MHAAIMLRDFALPNKPQVGCTRLAAVRLIAECADMFPLVSDYTHICFLLNLLLQLLLMLPLLLSRRAHATLCDLKSPFRYARRGCPRLHSHRGASAAAVVPRFRRDTTLPAEKFRRWWYSSPPCNTFGRWRLIPAGLPLCPALAALDAGLHLNQLIESKALLQYPCLLYTSPSPRDRG